MASTAATAAAPSLPAPLQSLLAWAASRQADRGITPAAPSNSTDDIVGAIPGAPLCALRRIPGQGVGVVLTRDVDNEVELMRASPAMQLRIDACAIADKLPRDDPWLALCLVLLYELSLGSRSAYAPYLDSLPRRLDLPMFWTPSQLAGLKGCSFLTPPERYRFFDLHADYDAKVVPFLQQHAVDAFTPRFCTFDKYQLVNGWILSRAFRPTCRPEAGPILMPLIDCCNTTSLQIDAAEPEADTALSSTDNASSTESHSQRINAAVHWVASEKDASDAAPTLVISTLPGSKLRAGQQIYIPYGSHRLSNASFLTRYGFVDGHYPDTENAFDEVAIDTAAIVDLVHGREPKVQGPGQQAESEDREAKKVHEKKVKKGETKEMPAAAAAASTGSEDENDSDGGSSASGDDTAYEAHVAYIQGLPFAHFFLPASGEPPLRLLQFISMLLDEGVVNENTFGHLCERDAYEAHMEEKRKTVSAKQRFEASKQSIAAAAAETSPAPVASPTSQVLSAPLDELHVHSSAFGEEDDEEPAFTLEMVQNIDERTRAQVEQSSEVYSQVFLVLHHLLSLFNTTLEDDVTLLEGIEKKRQQSLTFDDSDSAAPEDVDAHRLELAVRMRMCEKRVLYRALEHVKERITALSDAMDDELVVNSEDETADGAQPMQLVQQALLREAGEDADGTTGDGVGADLVDPNLMNPDLIAMLSAQAPSRRTATKRKEETAGTTELAVDEFEEVTSPLAQPNVRFTYTKSAAANRQANKKRRG